MHARRMDPAAEGAEAGTGHCSRISFARIFAGPHPSHGWLRADQNMNHRHLKGVGIGCSGPLVLKR